MRLKSAGFSVTLVLGISVLAPAPTRAQGASPPRAPLDRVIPDDVPALDASRMQALALRLRIAFGFEEAGALSEGVSSPFYMSSRIMPPIVSVRPRPVDGRGLTFRQALDGVVSTDRRYEWRDVDGVAVMRPAAAWRDAAHPLLRPVHGIHLDEASVAEVLDAVRKAIDPDWRGPTRPFGADARFTLSFDGGSLFDLLNAAARAHGALYWTLRSDANLIMLDGSRAVEAFEPKLTLGIDAGEMGMPLLAPAPIDRRPQR